MQNKLDPFENGDNLQEAPIEENINFIITFPLF